MGASRTSRSGRVPDVHAGLQQPEVRAPVAQRDDLPVQDHRAAGAHGEDGQFGVTPRHVLAGAGDQAESPPLT